MFMFKSNCFCLLGNTINNLFSCCCRPKRYIVCVRTHKCSCGRFQNDEISCGHGMTIFRYRRLHETDYCSPFYSLKNFEDAHVILVEPLKCESAWDIPSYFSEPKLVPPGSKRTVK
ncbi:hypothetical protein AABB24_021516 [Solanum stoloniferum]|uniref:SWIM-type domain-containing protein n=1 Tax=Solanum stoloniferum TaxID=62892 RepID=A0ABD2SVK9_9SOLN